MKRLDLSKTLGLVLAAAAITFAAAPAGEDFIPGPGPGLEIFDGAAPVNRPPSSYDSLPPSADQAATDAGSDAEQERERRMREGEREDFLSDPVYTRPQQQPPYQTPDARRRAATRPQQQPPRDDTSAEASFFDPYGDPFANLDGEDAPLPYSESPEMTGPPPMDPVRRFEEPAFDRPLAAEPFLPPTPEMTVLDAINIRNPNFPNLDAAALNNDLPGASRIIWETLKRRRVVETTMAHGVRASVGQITAYDIQRFMDAINQNPRGPEDPLRAAARINVILDAFQQPVIDDFTVGANMPQALIRLNEDIYRVGGAVMQYGDEGVFLELARTYVRAITSCDFFAYPRKQFAADVRDIMGRAGIMFYPDGSSRGGDTAGVTGNLFQIMLMLEYYTRNDSWFRRDMSSVWKVLQKPARYVLDVACPDMSLPNFGPRGSRELQPQEVQAIQNTFPRQPPRIQRIGLAASNSFPPASDSETYGGVYAMRDFPVPNGRFLAVRMGPMGDLLDVPIHKDFGSLVLMNRGTKYMVDAGGYGGNAAAARAHGGLSLNGNFAVETSYNAPDTVADAIWRTNASLDYVTDMAAFEDGKTWQRTVLYVKNIPGETMTDYWTVLDHVNVHGDPQPQTAVVRYQMAPGINLSNEGSGVLASGGMDGTGLRIYAVDAAARLEISDGSWGNNPGAVFDASGGSLPSPSVSITRQLTGDSTTATLLYPSDSYGHRPARIERDSDIVRGRTGLVVIDHGLDRLDVIAWAPLGGELITPTLNLQMSADLAVFRIRRGKIARIDFINLEKFQAKEPDGGMWSMRVNGPAQSIVIEPERSGGWQIMADPANRGGATFWDVNFGPTVTRRRFSIKPGEMRVIPR